MIGHPRDSGERTLNSLDTGKEWVERVRGQIEPFLALAFTADGMAPLPLPARSKCLFQ